MLIYCETKTPLIDRKVSPNISTCTVRVADGDWQNRRKENHNQSYQLFICKALSINASKANKKKYTVPILLKTKENVKSPIMFYLSTLQLNITAQLCKRK